MNYLLFLDSFRKKYYGFSDQALLFNLLREELQYLLLEFLSTKSSLPLYFMGGTQLRLSYAIPRFSEDIDMALDKPNSQFPSHEIESLLAHCFNEKTTGFRVKFKTNSRRNVVKTMVAFEQVLFDLALSPMRDSTLKIKIEVDTNPPAHASFSQKTYRSVFSQYLINAFDLPTGFAGKLSAVLLREYQKGRDYFDLQWYLHQRPVPTVNLDYLNANCAQQQFRTFKTLKDLLPAVMSKVKSVDRQLLKKDLERFIVMPEDQFLVWIENYSHETAGLLEQYIQSFSPTP